MKSSRPTSATRPLNLNQNLVNHQIPTSDASFWHGKSSLQCGSHCFPCDSQMETSKFQIHESGHANEVRMASLNSGKNDFPAKRCG